VRSRHRERERDQPDRRGVGVEDQPGQRAEAEDDGRTGTPEYLREVILATWDRPAPSELQRLLDVAEQPNVTVQLLPFDAGAPPVTAGSFSVLESRATGTEDVVYLENRTRIFFLDTEGEVHRYARSFELISEMALDPARSADRICRAMADL
jgi:hypothetical protein